MISTKISFRNEGGPAGPPQVPGFTGIRNSITTAIISESMIFCQDGYKKVSYNRTEIIGFSLHILISLLWDIHLGVKNGIREVPLSQTEAEESFLMGTDVAE